MIAGTKADTVIAIIEKNPLKTCNKVTEITLDMAVNRGLVAKKCFPNATRATDRFTNMFSLKFWNQQYRFAKFIFKNQSWKLYKKSELNTVGKQLTYKMKLQKKQEYQSKNATLYY